MGWPTGTGRIVHIEAVEPADSRTNWTEALDLANAAGQNVRPRIADVSPTGTTQGERSHGRWMAAGTWAGIVVFRGFTSGAGTIEVLIDAQSLGTVSTNQGNGLSLPVALPSTVVLAASGGHTVTIRKTTADGAVWFSELYLRKTS